MRFNRFSSIGALSSLLTPLTPITPITSLTATSFRTNSRHFSTADQTIPNKTISNPYFHSTTQRDITQNYKDEAIEIIGAKNAAGLNSRVLLTCEHASVRLPAPYQWTLNDTWLVGSHWTYDPGSEDFTRELSASLGCPAVMSRYSRLLLDPNRPVGSDTMFRNIADGKQVELNTRITEEEKQSRINMFYVPYHNALASFPSPSVVLSIHSFTPVYEGEKREVEIGVLFDPEHDRPLADKLKHALLEKGHKAELNVPWSGKGGFMYASAQFSSPHTPVIMFEFRQDLVTNRQWRDKVSDIIVSVLEQHKLASN